MVIEDRGDAIADGVKNRGIGAGLGAVERQVVVDLPPLLLSILQEVGGLQPLMARPRAKPGVDVGVALMSPGMMRLPWASTYSVSGYLGLELALGAHFDDRIRQWRPHRWNERGLSCE